MRWTPNISAERREAIARAGQAVVRLQIDPDASALARVHNDIVRNVAMFTDREAWDAVAALEDLVHARGLTTDAEMRRQRDERQKTASADLHAYLEQLVAPVPVASAADKAPAPASATRARRGPASTRRPVTSRTHVPQSNAQERPTRPYRQPAMSDDGFQATRCAICGAPITNPVQYAFRVDEETGRLDRLHDLAACLTCPNIMRPPAIENARRKGWTRHAR